MSRIREALKKAAEQRSAQAENSTEELIDVLNVEPAADASDVRQAPPMAAKFVPDMADRNDEGTRSYKALIAKCRRVQWNIRPRYSVFAPEVNRFSGAERFRTLRSRLYQISAAQPLKRVLLTSSIPEEGKTFVASNLAQSIVRQADRRVLMIDADLRASRLHLTLGTENEPGLSDYLSGEKQLTDIIQLGESDNFCFIPNGRYAANPSEILHSSKMKSLLDKMGELFDWVILDSPPAVAVHDASILADMCDGVLFVVRAGTTDYEIARKAASEFENKNLLGVVLNRVDRSDAYGAYYYYGYQHAPDGQ